MPYRFPSVTVVDSRCSPVAGTRSRGKTPGFTLVEVVAALAIIGVLSAIAVPRGMELVDRARVARATVDLHAMTTELLSQDSLPASLALIGRDQLQDPWGNTYIYYAFPQGSNGRRNPAGARKDRFLVPINSLFDLYSKGRDGLTQAPLTSKAGSDDVIVANDGGYIGLARAY